jgi:hypothetical protein
MNCPYPNTRPSVERRNFMSVVIAIGTIATSRARNPLTTIIRYAVTT